LSRPTQQKGEEKLAYEERDSSAGRNPQFTVASPTLNDAETVTQNERRSISRWNPIGSASISDSDEFGMIDSPSNSAEPNDGILSCGIKTPVKDEKDTENGEVIKVSD
jgi:hypothetical protein